MFSKHNWESTYFNIFWKFWNWPSYNRECLLYWLTWHLVIETSSLTVKKPMSALQYYLLWMWRHIGTWHWSYLSEPTDQENSPASGSKIEHTVITGHSSQLRMNGLLSCTSCMSWKCWCHSDIGPCGCWWGIQSHCITLSKRTMTCSIALMASCELWLRRRLNGRIICSWPWSWLNRSSPNIILNWLHRRVCISVQHICSILSGICDHLESGTR